MVRSVMGRFFLPGVLSLLFVLPGGRAAGSEETTQQASLRNLIVGKWQWENPGPTRYTVRLECFEGGEAKFSVRVNDSWSHTSAKYRVLDSSTVEVTLDIGNPFTPNPRTETWRMEVAGGRVTLKHPGTRLKLEQSR
jgi:hypothetical protein